MLLIAAFLKSGIHLRIEDQNQQMRRDDLTNRNGCDAAMRLPLRQAPPKIGFRPEAVWQRSFAFWARSFMMIVESGAGTAALLVSLPREALGPLDTKLGSSRLRRRHGKQITLK